MEFFNMAFWQLLVGTSIGAYFAIKAALHFTRQQDEKNSRLIVGFRMKVVLDLVWAELTHNTIWLEGWLKHSDDLQLSGLLWSKLRDDAWQALLSVGKLEEVGDPWVVFNVAQIYSQLRNARILSERLLTVIMEYDRYSLEVTELLRSQLAATVTQTLEELPDVKMIIDRALEAKGQSPVAKSG
jgi:hypothetical protein